MHNQKYEQRWLSAKKADISNYLKRHAIPQQDMLPDLGTHIVKRYKKVKVCSFIECEVSMIAPQTETETDVIFVTAFEGRLYLGTLIVEKNVDEVQAQLTSKYIAVTGTVSPEDKYDTSETKESVIPFRGTFTSIPQDVVMEAA